MTALNLNLEEYFFIFLLNKYEHFEGDNHLLPQK